MGKMVIGQAGKKYGLHRPGAPAKNSSVFANEDDDAVHEDVLKALTSDKHKEKMQKRVEKEMAKALAEDATIFDYDGVHDSIASAREEQAHNKKSSQRVGVPHLPMNLIPKRRADDVHFADKRRRQIRASFDRTDERAQERGREIV